MKEYVLGFLFSEDLKQVALIRKNRPAWQAGKLNGIGGKMENIDDGRSINAMFREFREETNLAESSQPEWKYFAEYSGFDFHDFVIYIFCQKGDLSKLESVTDENIEIVEVEDVIAGKHDVIDNLYWLLPLAKANLLTGNPVHAKFKYRTFIRNATPA